MTQIQGQQRRQQKDAYSDVQGRVSFAFWAQPVLQAADGQLSCPGFTGPTYLASPWDYLDIGHSDPLVQFEERRTPGKCEVTVRRGRDLDMGKGAGSDGTRITLHGIRAAMVEIAITIWTPQQLKMLDLLWAHLSPPAGKGDPGAFDVQYPKLKTHGIKSLIFYEADGPDIGPQRIARFVIRAVEYLPSKKKNATKTVKKTKAKDSLLDEKPTPGSNAANRGPT